ncbi:MAG: arginine--tRNA ligase [Chlorobi bacterium]|nr:arginine--tRNA ligase [Chlorobiota bacterium]
MKKYLISKFDEAKNKLEYLNEVPLQLSAPASKDHGDLATNIAMMLTKKLKRSPREVAAEILENLNLDENIVVKTEIAGPGFINFFFSENFTVGIIKEIIEKGEDFGKSDKYSGRKANVEFVSANPTGPLTVGHGRNAVLGDTVSNMLEWVGYEVDREFYFNNAGRQMRVLGDSVKHRYLQLLGEDIEFPEDYYQGEYISEIAKELFEEFGDALKNEPPEGKFKEKAENAIFDDIKKTLGSANIKMKNFFNEYSLYEDGKINDVLKKFEEKNLTYKKDDALWLKLTDLGAEQDKVIIKSTGEPTYRLPDIAYHITKFKRGYDLIVDVFGSDHSATYPDVLAAVKALGYDTEKVRVLIYQFVTLIKEGKVVKMSTRKANYVTLDELIEEVGKDVLRYFFIMRNASSHLNFDLSLAKKQSEENPVFYLQYAHARIASILRMTKDEGLNYSLERLDKLATPEEQNLIKKLYDFPEEVLTNAEHLEPHKIANYLEELATLFHKFYTECRIIGVEKELSEARISLAVAAQTVIRNGLTILGLSAPDRM